MKGVKEARGQEVSIKKVRLTRLTYMRDGGSAGIGSKPCTTLSEVPTRALKALPKTLLATRGDPNVMHRTSASGYSNADHAAPVSLMAWLMINNSTCRPSSSWSLAAMCKLVRGHVQYGIVTHVCLVSTLCMH